ncbi:MAG: molybdopterin-dependent oxidoreductase [Anaerolineae bacterium]|nr:molybdopterin-dependent oxidoreductase [Anaerolineae bacterium]
MRVKVWALVAVLLVVSLGACGSSAPKTDWTLEIGGAVSNPLALSYADLAEMEQVDLKEILMERSTGEDTVGSWSGVSLDKILADAGAPADFASITAIAADGYAIEVPKDELPDAIVALKEEGEWIATADPDHGPIRLVTPFTPANRWVFQLQVIQVNETSAGAAGIPENAALKITGNVENEIGWSEEKVRAMDTIEAQSTNKAGETSTYTGVLINDLLEAAGPKADATTVVFVADDGYTAEVTLAEVQGCADCIVSFRNQGGFSTVLPGFPGNVQVKGVVEIQVK